MSLEDLIRQIANDALDARKQELAQEAFVKKGTYGDIGDALRTKKGMAGIVKSNNILNGHRKAQTAADELRQDAESKERQGEKKQKEIHEVKYVDSLNKQDQILHRVSLRDLNTNTVHHHNVKARHHDEAEQKVIEKHYPHKNVRVIATNELEPHKKELKEDGGGMSCTSGMDINASGFPAEPKRKKKLRQTATIFKRKMN